MKWIIVLFGGLFLVTGAMGAQDWQLPPTYGETGLVAGFEPDPFEQSVVAGGSIDLSELGYYGYVAEAPDFDLRYTSGEYRLTITVKNTDADTLLLVNGPQGRWHFNDDTTGLHPSITFSPPRDGLYDIWVGTLDGDGAEATLVVTERD